MFIHDTQLTFTVCKCIALGMSLYILGSIYTYMYVYVYFYKKVFDQSRSAAISTTSFQKELWKIYWKLRTCCC